MSADAWAICPRCKANQPPRPTVPKYGTVPEKEYLAALRAADAPPPVLEETLRIYHEWSIGVKGEVTIAIATFCDACKLEFRLEAKKNMLG